MKLKKLFKDIPSITFKGSKDIEITGVCSNSKLAAPGNLFIARKGRSDDGSKYIMEAVETGAVAIVTDMYDPSLKNVVQVIHPEVSSIEGLIAAHYYQFPSDNLYMVGITGTNGKTTTAFLVKYLLDNIGASSGLMGTIEYVAGTHRYQATRTTPDVATNHKLLREMVLQGCSAAVMEVTSHALDQGRVDYIDYDVAVFTNLTIDHLDYHHTMEQYCAAKNRLFRSLGAKSAKKSYPKCAIVNADSLWHQKMLEGCSADVITYGIANQADLHASEIQLATTHTNFTLSYKNKKYLCRSPLIGRYNVSNCLAAMAVGLNYGCDLSAIIPIIGSFPPVPGRLELVPNALGLKIYVDFAHSDDALTNVLECLKELTKGRIIVVFGCGGDRDKTKRPKMAAAVEQYADFAIVTTDNSRSEVPEDICSQVVAGFKHNHSHTVELDRKQAIAMAIDMATAQDLIFIAGKGHQTYQIYAHKTIEFDDRKIAMELCEHKNCTLESIR